MLIQIDDVLKAIDKTIDHTEKMGREYDEIAPDLKISSFTNGYVEGLKFAKHVLEAQIDLEAIEEAKLYENKR